MDVAFKRLRPTSVATLALITTVLSGTAAMALPSPYLRAGAFANSATGVTELDGLGSVTTAGTDGTATATTTGGFDPTVYARVGGAPTSAGELSATRKR